MKEYLIESGDGSYFNQIACARESREPHAKDWIEIPEGAEVAARSGRKRSITFFRDNGTFQLVGDRWVACGIMVDGFTYNNLNDFLCFGGSSIVWQRHPPASDSVNQPSHYCSHPSGIECIEITRHHDFAVGNAIKYLWRAGLKSSDTEIQDLKKAVWYLQDKIKQLESKRG